MKQPIFYAILVVAIIITFVWSAISNQIKNNQTKKTTETEQTTQKISNLTNADPTDFDSILKEEFSSAQKKALAANPDNQFSALEVEIPATLLVDGTTNRYVFSAKTDAQNNWMITLTEPNEDFIRALVPKEDYIGDLTPIDTKLWKYNFVTALQLAEKNGGLEWRDKNTLSGIKLTLRNLTDKNVLTWTVKYSSQNNADFTVKLDANSGKAITD